MYHGGNRKQGGNYQSVKGGGKRDGTAMEHDCMIRKPVPRMHMRPAN